MASFDLDDLIEPLTREEVQQSVYDVLGIVGVDTTSWKPGAVVRTMIAATAVVLSSFSELQARIARSGFLEFSSDAWLTFVARYVYGVERIMATFAVGDLTLHNGGGGVYSFDADDLIFSNPTSGKTYRNVAGFSLGSGETVVIQIQATEPGSASTSGAHTIVHLVTTVLGVSCDNDSPAIGTDEESDATLRARCQEKLGSLSPFGPWDAYAYAVRSATFPDGSSIGVNRIRIVKDGYGNVNTVVASSSGDVPGDVDDPDTALGIAYDAIQKRAAPLSVNATVESAEGHAIPVTYTAWMYNTSSLTQPQIETKIRLALDAFMARQPIGGNVVSGVGKVYKNGIEAAILDAMPEIFDVSVSTPAGDTTLSANEVALRGTLAVTAINQEPPPEGFGGAL